MVLLHHMDPRAGPCQLPAQVHTDSAASQDRYILYPLEAAAHALEHFVQLGLAAYHVQPVLQLGHEGAVGDDELIAPLGGAD